VQPIDAVHSKPALIGSLNGRCEFIMPNDRTERCGRRVRFANRRGPPAFAPVILLGHFILLRIAGIFHPVGPGPTDKHPRQWLVDLFEGF
jgi:hypothetical protein